MGDIAELFAGLRFAKRIVGGVEERDVWKKLDEVQTAYRRVYEAQHERDLALIKERDETIRKLSASLEQIKKLCGESAAGVNIQKAPEPYQDNEPKAEGTARKSDQNNESGVKGVSRDPDRHDGADINDAGRNQYRDSRPEVKSAYREEDRDDGTIVKGSSREPDQNRGSDIVDAGRRQYWDNEPGVEGVSREPAKAKSSRGTTKTSPVRRGSIDSLSSDSSAEADLAFDWLDDGDFNL